MADAVIFKIVPALEWRAAYKAGIYHGSAHDKADGFLHFSTASQTIETLRLYYSDTHDFLTIAGAECEKLGSALKYDYSASRNEAFPHLYGPLPMEAVCSAIYFPPQFVHKERLQKWLDWAAAGAHGPSPYETE